MEHHHNKAVWLVLRKLQQRIEVLETRLYDLEQWTRADEITIKDHLEELDRNETIYDNKLDEIDNKVCAVINDHVRQKMLHIKWQRSVEEMVLRIRDKVDDIAIKSTDTDAHTKG